MSWADFIKQYRAADVVSWTKAPLRTIYDWRNGAEPPPYVQEAMRELIVDGHDLDDSRAVMGTSPA